MTGADLIVLERTKQIEKHKRTTKYDREHNEQEQLISAASGILEEPLEWRQVHKRPLSWNKTQWNKLCSKPLKERIIIAGAFLAAEYDRRNN